MFVVLLCFSVVPNLLVSPFCSVLLHSPPPSRSFIKPDSPQLVSFFYFIYHSTLSVNNSSFIAPPPTSVSLALRLLMMLVAVTDLCRCHVLVGAGGAAKVCFLLTEWSWGAEPLTEAAPQEHHSPNPDEMFKPRDVQITTPDHKKHGKVTSLLLKI